jgi:hypothetical protein
LAQCQTARDFTAYLAHCPDAECVSRHGSHTKWRSRKTGRIVVFPAHGNEVIPVGTRRAIVRLVTLAGLAMLILLLWL